MELISINLARLVSFLEVQALDPFGRTSELGVFNNVGSRYSFSKVPQTFAEIDLTKGVELIAGKLGDINIDKLAFYPKGIVIDTRSSTDDCLKVLHDLLSQARELFGATITPSRQNLVSQIVFRSSLRLSLLNPLLQPVADQIEAAVSDGLRQSVMYEPTAVLWAPDLSQIKLAPVVFSIERRADIPFSENTYFSSAPLGTNAHLEMLQKIEASLLPRS